MRAAAEQEKSLDQAVESGHVLDTRSGTAPRCRRSQAWRAFGPRLSKGSNLCL